jgi:CRISPR-associated protein Csm4
MKLVRFRLAPMSHFHFGEIAQDENSNLATTSSSPHSDTLFSSLVNCYANVKDRDEVNSFVDGFKKRDTVISSMFYYLKIENDFIYFLPKPLNYNTQSIKRDDYKKLKKIEFISLGVLKSITKTNDFFNEDKCNIIQNQFVVLKEEIAKTLADKINIYSKVTQPKNSIRTEDGNVSIYFETDVEIADNSKLEKEVEIGYYFLYESNQENCLKEAIVQMVLSGIGGSRSTGGALGSSIFEVTSQFNQGDIKAPFFCISMSIPGNAEEFKKFELYETKIRGGRKMTIGKQKFIRMIKEGAVLSSLVNGAFANIGIDESDNQILRNGSCFLLPLKKN